MKAIKILLAFLLVTFASFKATAQSQAVLQLREVIKEIPNRFENLMEKKFQENSDTSYYISKLRHAGEHNNVYIMKTPKASKYFIFNDWNKNNSEVYKLQTMLLGIYQDELNNMVKSGKYNRNDSEQDGTTVTMIRNREGESVISLMNDKNSFYMIIYSWHY